MSPYILRSKGNHGMYIEAAEFPAFFESETDGRTDKVFYLRCKF